MRNFKGTQGKWFVDNGVGVTSVNSKRFPAGIDSIATVKNQFHNDETKANALLISKAPELLEEHQTDIDQLEIWIEWLSDLEDDEKYIGITDTMKSQLQVKKDLVKSSIQIL